MISRFWLKIGLYLFVMFFMNQNSMAKNLGVWGTLYPIAEADLKEFIYNRLATMQQNGELLQAEQQFISNVKEHSYRPNPVNWLTTTDTPQIFYYDPTLVLNRNIKDATGHILFAKGTTINPLVQVKLHSVLFFFNADDKRQIVWALANAKHYAYVKYILVKGNIKLAADALNNRVYFDQQGLLSKKLGIKHVPCIVSQDKLRLKIKEVALKEEPHAAN